MSERAISLHHFQDSLAAHEQLLADIMTHSVSDVRDEGIVKAREIFNTNKESLKKTIAQLKSSVEPLKTNKIVSAEAIALIARINALQQRIQSVDFDALISPKYPLERQVQELNHRVEQLTINVETLQRRRPSEKSAGSGKILYQQLEALRREISTKIDLCGSTSPLGRQLYSYLQRLFEIEPPLKRYIAQLNLRYIAAEAYDDRRRPINQGALSFPVAIHGEQQTIVGSNACAVTAIQGARFFLTARQEAFHEGSLSHYARELTQTGALQYAQIIEYLYARGTPIGLCPCFHWEIDTLPFFSGLAYKETAIFLSPSCVDNRIEEEEALTRSDPALFEEWKEEEGIDTRLFYRHGLRRFTEGLKEGEKRVGIIQIDAFYFSLLTEKKADGSLIFRFFDTHQTSSAHLTGKELSGSFFTHELDLNRACCILQTMYPHFGQFKIDLVERTGDIEFNKEIEEHDLLAIQRQHIRDERFLRERARKLQEEKEAKKQEKRAASEASSSTVIEMPSLPLQSAWLELVVPSTEISPELLHQILQLYNYCTTPSDALQKTLLDIISHIKSLPLLINGVIDLQEKSVAKLNYKLNMWQVLAYVKNQLSHTSFVDTKAVRNAIERLLIDIAKRFDKPLKENIRDFNLSFGCYHLLTKAFPKKPDSIFEQAISAIKERNESVTINKILREIQVRAR